MWVIRLEDFYLGYLQVSPQVHSITHLLITPSLVVGQKQKLNNNVQLGQIDKAMNYCYNLLQLLHTMQLRNHSVQFSVQLEFDESNTVRLMSHQ